MSEWKEHYQTDTGASITDGVADYLVNARKSDLWRLATLETAVLTIIKAMQSYLPPDGGVSKDQFISEVIGAVDNPAVFAALHGTSDAENDSLKRALERGR